MVYGHVVAAFEFGNRASFVNHRLHLRFDTLQHIARIDFDRVDKGLIVEQFLHQQILQSLVLRVAVGGIALCPALLHQLVGELLHLRIRDGRIADYGNHLIQHHETFLGLHGTECRTCQHCYQYPLHYRQCVSKYNVIDRYSSLFLPNIRT